MIHQYANPWLTRHCGERFARSFVGIYQDPWKYVSYSDGERALFDLSRDPGETANLVDGFSETSQAATLARWLDRRQANSGTRMFRKTYKWIRR